MFGKIRNTSVCTFWACFKRDIEAAAHYILHVLTLDSFLFISVLRSEIPPFVFSRRALSLIEPYDRLDKIKLLKTIIWKEEGKREYNMK